MQLQKPQLFTDIKSFIWVILFLSSIIVLRLVLSYQEYRSFISKPFFYTYAEVISEKNKTKNGKHYKILKLQEENGLRFITTSYDKVSYTKKRLRLQIFPTEKISFRGYMGTFFVKSRIKKATPVSSSFKDRLMNPVTHQHKDTKLASFYNAIFFATELDSTLRDQISKLGISHLVALSGFHLGYSGGFFMDYRYTSTNRYSKVFFPIGGLH